MITEVLQSSRVNEYVYRPPNLPPHLSIAYGLKPIVGSPTDDDVKAIHAAIGAVDASARVPHLYDPNLSLQLSQHLFSVQIAVYRKHYSLDLFLDAMRVSESLGRGPLSDTDLNMKLSQHLFNLQLARYIQDSALGQFSSKLSELRRVRQESQADSATPQGNTDVHLPPEHIPANFPEAEAGRSFASANQAAQSGCQCSTASEITKQGEVMKDIRELMGKSKGVLEHMSRVLKAIQRNQIIVGEWSNHNYAHVNPVNEQGITAREGGLPLLRFSYHQGRYWTHINADILARYLKFFGVGSHVLIEGGESPRIKDGAVSEAERVLFKHMGVIY